MIHKMYFLPIVPRQRIYSAHQDEWKRMLWAYTRASLHWNRRKDEFDVKRCLPDSSVLKQPTDSSRRLCNDIRRQEHISSWSESNHQRPWARPHAPPTDHPHTPSSLLYTLHTPFQFRYQTLTPLARPWTLQPCTIWSVIDTLIIAASYITYDAENKSIL